MYRLRVVPARSEPFDHMLDQSELIIGRASACGLPLSDPFLSRSHARLFSEDDQLFLEDLGSRNGTLLNDRPVEAITPVRPGDVIRLSSSTITVHWADDRRTSTSDDFGGVTVFRRASDLLDRSETDTGEIVGEDSLRRYAERLKLINEVHSALASSLELEPLLDLILERAFDHLKPEEGVIFLKDADGTFLRAASRTLPGLDSGYLYSQTLLEEVTGKGLAALVLDARTDERFAEAKSIMSSGVRSLVAAPLLDPAGSLGMIALNSRLHKRRFSEDDMELLTSLASVAALRIRNVALAQEAAERRRLEQEIALARRIQVALLPQELPVVPGFEIHGGNVPSRGVSGDYYEVVPRTEGAEVLLMVADVSGKGMAASLLTASLEALTAGPIEMGYPPDEICYRVSKRLFHRTPPERYATAFLAVVEPATGKVGFTNAGHNPGLVVRAGGEIEQLTSTGMPLGLFADASYDAKQVRLQEGDLLVLYTDGLTEATNESEQEFGVGRLSAILVENRTAQLAELARLIEDRLEEFVGDEPFADDRTIVMARRGNR